ncbi:NhaP-type Na+/H+ or K+/H+ antiporter [Paraburkholderia sp. WC7.3g]
MNKQFIAALLIAASAAATGPAFASSGFGPAPHYDPIAGAPA